ncbi:MAG: ubiquinol-cytochrome c reductase iron-sulfur subunit [Pseudomonadota bacterium]
MSDASQKQPDELPTRRDFIHVATGMLGVVGAAAVVWPFIDSMAPDAAVLAAGLPVEIDVSPIEEGQVITVNWRGKPYFIRKLTDAELSTAGEVVEGDLKDFESVEQRVAGDGAAAPAPGWVIVAANCTHLGCVPNIVDNAPEGWFCPCHGSVFDMTGRILRGPAATNLPLPPYVFANETTLVIGTDQA